MAVELIDLRELLRKKAQSIFDSLPHRDRLLVEDTFFPNGNEPIDDSVETMVKRALEQAMSESIQDETAFQDLSLRVERKLAEQLGSDWRQQFNGSGSSL